MEAESTWLRERTTDSWWCQLCLHAQRCSHEGAERLCSALACMLVLFNKEALS
jgi:hypothetical protein